MLNTLMTNLRLSNLLCIRTNTVKKLNLLNLIFNCVASKQHNIFCDEYRKNMLYKSLNKFSVNCFIDGRVGFKNIHINDLL